MSSLTEDYLFKIKVLNETLWEMRVTDSIVSKWINNFYIEGDGERNKVHALHLLSCFSYFGITEIRELLVALYRDLFKYHLIQKIRRDNGDTTDSNFIHENFIAQLEQTRFLGIGNPSESGTHLLYYFRQENNLSKKLFINTHEIFTREASTGNYILRDDKIKHYVFIDDLCGSGTQAIQYSRQILEHLRELNDESILHYHVLFATKDGLEKIKSESKFDIAKAVFELDESYQCFSDKSRYFTNTPKEIDHNYALTMAEQYGRLLWPIHPLGYKNGQLLLGFCYNIPDNTLPIFWYGQATKNPWTPIFKRYHKIY